MTEGKAAEPMVAVSTQSTGSHVSLASKEHKALLAFELEVVSAKFGRYGWSVDSPVNDRVIRDWIDKLSEYSLEEVKAAISLWMDNPRNHRAPHENDIAGLVKHVRKPPPKMYERRVIASGQVQEWDGYNWGNRNDLTTNEAGEVVQRVLS